jgi:hypothetical protein
MIARRTNSNLCIQLVRYLNKARQSLDKQTSENKESTLPFFEKKRESQTKTNAIPNI